MTYLLNGNAGTESRLALYIGDLVNKFTQIIRIDEADYRKRIFGKPFYEARIKVASIPINEGEIFPNLIKQMDEENVNIGTIEVVLRAPKGGYLGEKL